MSYIKVPRELIYAKEIGDKRVSCFSYFVYHYCVNDRSFFNCNYLVTWCGFKPKRDKGSMNDKFRLVIEWMYSNNMIYNCDASTFKPKDFTGKNTIVVNTNKDWLFPNKNFGLIFDFEIEKITDYSKSNKLHMDRKTSHATLLLILAYIRCNIRIRPKESYDVISEIKKKPEIFYHKYIDISEDIGIPVRICSKCIDILCSLEIIAKSELPRFQDSKGNWHTNSTIFANRYKYEQGENGNPEQNLKYHFQQELEFGAKLVSKKPFRTKKYKTITMEE